MRDYQLVSPSLEGILSHELLSYDGLRRPIEILRILDGPISKGKGKQGLGNNKNTLESVENQKKLEEYSHDLYGIFMKKLSYFIVESSCSDEDSLKLQAMLQEMIKIKKLMYSK